MVDRLQTSDVIAERADELSADDAGSGTRSRRWKIHTRNGQHPCDSVSIEVVLYDGQSQRIRQRAARSDKQ